MLLKKDVLQLTSIFVILIILLIFGGYYLLLGSHVRVALLLVSMIPLFVLMVLKGKVSIVYCVIRGSAVINNLLILANVL